jgi:dolichol-phosphate mannosyltransferase
MMRAILPEDTQLSVVVPTLNEGANLPYLVQRIGAALKGRAYEILVIDDGSSDDTLDVCQYLSERYPVYLHVRPDAKDGLSGAVVYGLSRARGEYLIVMDADLQHPPEQILDLVEPLERDEAEFVIGSRYVDGAHTDERWGPLRRANSALATVLSRPLTGTTRDPMSGFFALKADTFQRAGHLKPIGYKIGLELMCKCRVRRVREIPIRFGLRQTGESKLSVQQRLHFLDHLSGLYDFRYPRGSAWAKWAVVNGCAWLIAFGLYVRLVAHDVNPALAPAVAFLVAVAATSIFKLHSVRTHERGSRDWADFALVASGQWAACALSAQWVANHAIHTTVTQVFALTFGIAAVAGYTLTRQLNHAHHHANQIDGDFSSSGEKISPMRRAA